MTHERQIAKEIRDEYVDTMSKIYYSYFKGYLSRLTKLQVPGLSLYVCVYIFLWHCVHHQWRIQREGVVRGAAPPIGSFFSSKSHFFQCKGYILRCAHLR